MHRDLCGFANTRAGCPSPDAATSSRAYRSYGALFGVVAVLGLGCLAFASPSVRTGRDAPPGRGTKSAHASATKSRGRSWGFRSRVASRVPQYVRSTRCAGSTTTLKLFSTRTTRQSAITTSPRA